MLLSAQQHSHGLQEQLRCRVTPCPSRSQCYGKASCCCCSVLLPAYFSLNVVTCNHLGWISLLLSGCQIPGAEPAEAALLGRKALPRCTPQRLWRGNLDCGSSLSPLDPPYDEKPSHPREHCHPASMCSCSNLDWGGHLGPHPPW